MSYDDYFRKLNFSGVSSSIDSMKAKEVANLTSDVNSKFTPQIDSLQSSIDTLTAASSSNSTVDNIISTASSTSGGVMSTGAIIKKLMKEKGGSKEGDEEGESKGGEEPAEGDDPAPADDATGDSNFMEALQNDDFDSMKSMLNEESASLGGDTDGLSSMADSLPDSVPSMAELPESFSDTLGSVRQALSSDPQVTDTPLAQSQVEVPNTEFGSGTMDTTEPAGSGSGNIEMQTFSANDGVDSSAPEMTGTGPSAPGGNVEMQTFSSNAEEGTAEAGETAAQTAGETAAETAGEVAGETAGEVAGDVALDAGIEAGVQVAGAALDSTGILAPIGILLEIGGGIFAGVEAAEQSTDNPNSDASIALGDKTQMASLQSQASDQISKAKAQVAQQHFTGANVMPSLDTTTLQNVTSAAF